MSRKEHLKKSLGISEYPWSSDDEEGTGSSQNLPDVHILRRQASEPRPSVADMPGTSGQQAPTSPTLSPARRNQAKAERDLYWTLLNNPHKSIGVSRSSSSRLLDLPPLQYAVPLRPVVHTPAAELCETRPSAAADLQRMFAFKKLTNKLNNLRAAKTCNLYANSSRGSLRNPIFTSSSTPDVAHLAAKNNRAHLALKRLQASRSTLRWDSHRCGVGPSALSPEQVQASGGQRAFERRDAPAPPAAATDAGTPENNNVPEPVVEENPNVSDEPIDVETSHNNSSGGVSLEEEIVEIDAPDETDANITGEDNNDTAVVNADVGLNEVAVPANEDNVGLQSPERKRRREGNTSPEDGEPYTVKEFNQSLLRLLECPVCLEWMEPPMSQCRRGHLVCGRCRARLASCPVCRTTFSSVRNRAMEGVAEMVRYPCRHGCGREVRLRRRAGHEASCAARRYHCPAPACAERAPLPRDHLHQHFQSKHMSMLKMGRAHKFSLKVNSEQHDTWLLTALHEYFYLRVDVDMRAWGVNVYVAYIGPKCNARNYTYEVSIVGQHNSRKLSYARATHSDLESYSLNVSSQDCFHLTIDQALNFLRIKNRHCEPDKFLDFHVEISKCENENRDNSDS
ncbi:hypothetical protein ABMA28_015775 [Loxostege sticticalis]|uniref:E3 ubiquitin-protein ligase n=1 Tax=Loxostege sticticalis TaxID=481309 RepID=A0ABD0TB00_LOXSC